MKKLKYFISNLYWKTIGRRTINKIVEQELARPVNNIGIVVGVLGKF